MSGKPATQGDLAMVAMAMAGFYLLYEGIHNYWGIALVMGSGVVKNWIDSEGVTKTKDYFAPRPDKTGRERALDWLKMALAILAMAVGGLYVVFALLNQLR